VALLEITNIPVLLVQHQGVMVATVEVVLQLEAMVILLEVIAVLEPLVQEVIAEVQALALGPTTAAHEEAVALTAEVLAAVLVEA